MLASCGQGWTSAQAVLFGSGHSPLSIHQYISRLAGRSKDVGLALYVVKKFTELGRQDEVRSAIGQV